MKEERPSVMIKGRLVYCPDVPDFGRAVRRVTIEGEEWELYSYAPEIQGYYDTKKPIAMRIR
jgi:hypothetical protein